MEKVLSDVSAKRPGFLPWLMKYGRTWFHQPYYDGQESNWDDGETIRVLGPNTFSNCCAFTETLFSLADHLNMTLEYVVYDGPPTGGADILLADAAKYFAEQEADIVSLPSHLVDEELADISQLTPTHYEVHEIAVLVPKQIGGASFNNFLSTMLPEVLVHALTT